MSSSVVLPWFLSGSSQQLQQTQCKRELLWIYQRCSGRFTEKMFNYVYMKSESLILTDSTATCLTLQFLYSQEEASTVGELWAHYKTTGGNRHVKRIELEYKKANGKKHGNTLILTFSKSCNKGPHPNRVEYEVRER
uniref:Putative secreted salivary gland peptide n=1 Tax=Ixodes ricinus TaxID=34613 RepID=A0A090XBC6_IXORI